MVKSFGRPEAGIAFGRQVAGRVRLNDRRIDLVQEALAQIDETQVVADIGKSSRTNFSRLRERALSAETLDIAQYADYPDIAIDLCSPLPVELEGRYSLIYCAAVLEHVYDPFIAARNLLSMLSKGGVLFVYTPWLFPYHADADNYQDFWRFSPDGIGMLFNSAKRIEVFPTRGRIATSLLVLTYRYKSFIEGRFPSVSLWINGFASSGRNVLQTSGYNAIIWK